MTATPASDHDLLATFLKVGQERSIELAVAGALDGPEIGAWLLLLRLGAIDEVPIPSAAFASDQDKRYLAEEFLPRVVAEHSATAALLINTEWMVDLDVNNWEGFGSFIEIQATGLNADNATRYVTLDAVTLTTQSSQRGPLKDITGPDRSNMWTEVHRVALRAKTTVRPESVGEQLWPLLARESEGQPIELPASPPRLESEWLPAIRGGLLRVATSAAVAAVQGDDPALAEPLALARRHHSETIANRRALIHLDAAHDSADQETTAMLGAVQLLCDVALGLEAGAYTLLAACAEAVAHRAPAPNVTCPDPRLPQMAERIRELSEYLPGPLVPATGAQLVATEILLGRQLPGDLRWLYANVANGGFGSKTGFLGAIGGHSGEYTDLVQGYLCCRVPAGEVGGLEHRDEAGSSWGLDLVGFWPDEFAPLSTTQNMGGVTRTFVNLETGAVHALHSSAAPGASIGDCLFEVAPSVADFVESWLQT